MGILNVGKIEGGISWNVIPDDVTFWLETRAERCFGGSDEVGKKRTQEKEAI